MPLVAGSMTNSMETFLTITLMVDSGMIISLETQETITLSVEKAMTRLNGVLEMATISSTN